MLGGQTKVWWNSSHYPGNLGSSHQYNKVGGMEEKGGHQTRSLLRTGPTGKEEGVHEELQSSS